MESKHILNVIGGLSFCALVPFTRAQCPQICDANQNTAFGLGAGPGGVQSVAVGELALKSGAGGNCVAVGFAALASGDGFYQTALGAGALQFSTGSQNTGVGYEALYGVGGSSTGSNNTATGYQALYKNTGGGSNTATGYAALFFNSTGNFNTAIGRGALYKNTTANNNVATGYQALNSNKTGTANTATGTQALQSDTGSDNTADGYQALNKNTVGVDNVATGYQALLANTSGITNVAVGAFALDNSLTGAGNIAIGFAAGSGVTSGSNNIDIANNGANESSTIRIGSTNQANTYVAGIYGVTVAGGIGVIVDSSGHLGTTTSSARFKENIQPMEKASEAILRLHPVTFRYRKELDPKAIPQFGLVAEQVEKVDPDLVACDEQGKPFAVRYDEVNAMLLNEFLKAHRTIAAQQSEIQGLKATMTEMKTILDAQAAAIQKVNARVTKVEGAPRVVVNAQ